VTLHTSSDLDSGDVSIQRGVICTNPLRTLLDLGAVEPDAVPAALVSTAVSRLVVPGAARAALDRTSVRGRPGLGALRAALDDWPLGDQAPDSELEVVVARLLKVHRLTGFQFHPRIAGLEVDFAHRRKRVVIEADGWEFHSARPAFEEDRRRDALLAAEGWLVVRVTWWQAVEQPLEVAERLRAALDRRFRRGPTQHIA
jgi:very-short-patch-repair endonuclease